MSTTRPELLSPAGDWERLKTAILYGADAVYLGLYGMSMRAGCGFHTQELAEAVRYAHAHGVRVYLTCNTLPRAEEADRLEDFLYHAHHCAVDALIVADVGILALAQRCAPGVAVHVSTQAGVVNWRTATQLYMLGATRAVLARELSLNEIADIRAKTPPGLELEAFVHGSMCMSFSGRCLLSDYFTGRDANRGDCAQPCRWKYHLTEEKRPGLYYPLREDTDGSYILNAKDLCMMEHLDQLHAAGISSLKIEGRAKSAYYVGVITNAYRAAVETLSHNPYAPPAWALAETQRVSHRAYCTGFYFGRPENGQFNENAGYIRTWEVVAVVVGYEPGWLLLTQRNHFTVADTLEMIAPGNPPVVFLPQALYDGVGNLIDAARHPMMQLRIPSSQPFAAGSMLRKSKGL